MKMSVETLWHHFDRWQTIVYSVSGVTFSGIVLKIKAIVKTRRAKTDEKFELLFQELENQRACNKALLHNKIYTQCETHLTEGFISIEALDDLTHLYKAYKQIGGNGTGEEIYNRVKELPIYKKGEY